MCGFVRFIDEDNSYDINKKHNRILYLRRPVQKSRFLSTGTELSKILWGKYGNWRIRSYRRRLQTA